ncbi:NfeD family protein [Pseudochryseolinea flava]|nr:NfeD family protein [Pseudochryseolinea flava]
MWTIILTLLLIGLALIIVELVFIPGTTVVGLLGLTFSIAAIVISYNHFGKQVGVYILLGSLLVSGVALFFSFRSNAWSAFALTSAIKSRVNEGALDFLKVGDIGVTISALRPMGKVSFNDQIIEVKTTGNYLDQGTKVKVTGLVQNQVIVEPFI